MVCGMRALTIFICVIALDPNCGWCKVMDKKTFSNQKLIEYINSNFYCIHFDAERKDSVTFNGKPYGRIPSTKTNELAADWMRNKLSYPTSIFFDENFANPQPIPGYLETPTMEMILKYFGENKHKSTPWEKYKAEFKGEWK
jgi:thioredoxin-related protein